MKAFWLEMERSGAQRPGNVQYDLLVCDDPTVYVIIDITRMLPPLPHTARAQGRASSPSSRELMDGTHGKLHAKLSVQKTRPDRQDQGVVEQEESLVPSFNCFHDPQAACSPRRLTPRPRNGRIHASWPNQSAGRATSGDRQ
jgi:hypothetical protein